MPSHHDLRLQELTSDLAMSRAETDEAMTLLRATRANERALADQLAALRLDAARLEHDADASYRDKVALRRRLDEVGARLAERDEDNARLRGAIGALACEEGGREEAEALEKGLEALLRGSGRPASVGGGSWREVESGDSSGSGSGSEVGVSESVSSKGEGSGILLASGEEGGGVDQGEGAAAGEGGDWIEV